jgi:hypothetical protein
MSRRRNEWRELREDYSIKENAPRDSLFVMLKMRDPFGQNEQEFFTPIRIIDGKVWLFPNEVFSESIQRVKARSRFIVQFWSSWYEPTHHRIILDRTNEPQLSI